MPVNSPSLISDIISFPTPFAEIPPYEKNAVEILNQAISG
jgi:hypothetical protein